MSAFTHDSDNDRADVLTQEEAERRAAAVRASIQLVLLLFKKSSKLFIDENAALK